jgi:DNA-binding response OmpR family regulator
LREAALSFTYSKSHDIAAFIQIASSFSAAIDPRTCLHGTVANRCLLMPTPALEKILLVDDDPAIRSAVGRLLSSAGYQPLEAADGATALEILRRDQPRVTILDIEMPGLGGLGALSQLRRDGSDLSVIILSGLTDVEHRLRGLDLGADDYIAKPFDPRELLARIDALLRRVRKITHAPKRKWQRGDVLIDLDAKHAARGGRRLPLTSTEFAILETLAASEGQPVSRETLLHVVWGYSLLANTRTLETHIWRLRKKLGDKAGEPGWIVNRPGLGYVLSVSSG